MGRSGINVRWCLLVCVCVCVCLSVCTYLWPFAFSSPEDPPQSLEGAELVWQVV